MSVLDLILSNRLILLSLGFVALSLLFALLLFVLPQMKRAGKALAKLVTREASTNTLDETEFTASFSAEDYEEELEEQEEVLAAKYQSMAATKQETPVQAPPETGQAPDALQSIISSVFEDEEALERKANLLKSSKAIDIHELAAALEALAQDLGLSIEKGI